MDLKGIISISGKSGLFKVIGQGKNTLIVESLIDGKRFPAFTSNKISALEDITMFTTDEDIKLSEVIKKIYEKEKGGKAIEPSKEGSELRKYFEQIVPNFDQDRVFNSDLKKLFTWYDILQSSGTLKKLAEEADNKNKQEDNSADNKATDEIASKPENDSNSELKQPRTKKSTAGKKSSKKASDTDTTVKKTAKKKSVTQKDSSK
jgi:hypothetical protein